jgi:hypothetical protein
MYAISRKNRKIYFDYFFGRKSLKMLVIGIPAQNTSKQSFAEDLMHSVYKIN